MKNGHESQPGLKARKGPIMNKTQVFRLVSLNFFSEKSLEQPETVLIEFVNQILIYKQCCGTITTFYLSGSCSDFWKVTFPVLTSYKLRFWFRIYTINSKVRKKIGKKSYLFTLEAFYKEKPDKFHQMFCKMWMKRMWNEENQMHKFIPCVCENFCDTILLLFRNRN